MALESIYQKRYTFQSRTINTSDWVRQADELMHKTWECVKCGIKVEKVEKKEYLKDKAVKQSLESEALFQLAERGCPHISTNNPEIL